MLKNKDLIIAHRGESQDAPENTLAAVNLAWDRGATAVEIDIQLTKDNKIVVIHDTDTFRVSGVKKIIKNSNFNDLSLLDIGTFKGEQFRNERIPLLKDVLKTIPENGKLIIEIKSNQKILEELKLVLSQSELNASQIEIIAFNLKTLATAKIIMPQYHMLWLLDLDYYQPRRIFQINKQKIIQKVKKHNFDGVNVWAGKILNEDFIKTFKKEGLYVYTWTVNEYDKAKLLLEAGIDGITTDKAEWMTKQLLQNNPNQ